MRFRITCKGKTTQENVEKVLEKFISEANDEYQKQLKGSKLVKLQRMTPMPIRLPEEMAMAYYHNDRDVMFIAGANMPLIGWFRKKISKKMCKNLMKFLKAHKLDVDVVYDDEKEGKE